MLMALTVLIIAATAIDVDHVQPAADSPLKRHRYAPSASDGKPTSQSPSGSSSSSRSRSRRSIPSHKRRHSPVIQFINVSPADANR
ncbi:GL23325 [Drosophila persimilis]|uniref:GL23325 n=1 Tax=Drosophila persimilis TaxID=7234 RepID=B4G4Q9_DROPE|nr:GL23325 [Drosophila persimilis]